MWIGEHFASVDENSDADDDDDVDDDDVDNERWDNDLVCENSRRPRLRHSAEVNNSILWRKLVVVVLGVVKMETMTTGDGE